MRENYSNLIFSYRRKHLKNAQGNFYTPECIKIIVYNCHDIWVFIRANLKRNTTRYTASDAKNLGIMKEYFY